MQKIEMEKNFKKNLRKSLDEQEKMVIVEVK